ncbi:MAG: hypothetical protein AAFQ18_11860 [Pseudomonadota bacterium]
MPSDRKTRVSSRPVWAVLAIAALAATAAHAAAGGGNGDVDLFEVDVAAAEIDQVCLPLPRKALVGYDLSEPVFDDRFYYADVFGRGGRSVLIEFSQPCWNFAAAPGGLGGQTPFCKTDTVVIENERCFVETLYVAESEAEARVIALKRRVADARAAGEALPENDAEAAEILIARAANTN